MTDSTPSRIPGLHGAFIQRRLPDWLKHLGPQDLLRLRRSLLGTPGRWLDSAEPSERLVLEHLQRRSRGSAAQLGRALKGHEGLGAFATRLLKARLKSQLGVELDVHSVQLVRLHREPELAGSMIKLVPQQCSLLQAALQNFSAEETFEAGSALAPEGAFSMEMLAGSEFAVPVFAYRFSERLAIAPERFARLCHALDLGGQYQRHLAAIYQAPAKQAGVRQALVAAWLDQLRVALQVAFIKRKLSAAQLKLFATTLLAGGAVFHARPPLQASRLQLFNVPLSDAWLFTLQTTPEQSVLVLYLPAAPQPLTVYPNWSALLADQRRRWRIGAWRTALGQCLPQAEQARVFARLDAALYHLVRNAYGVYERRADPEGNLRLFASVIEQDLFVHLYDSHLDKLKADARYLAVPSAELDAQARQARLAHWEAVGFDLLNAVAFVVPAVATVMLLVTAVQLTAQVVEGVQAWAHFSTVGLNLAIMGGLVLGGRALLPMDASPVLDRLRRVYLPNGEQRLWQPALEAYASSVDLTALEADSQGLYRDASGSSWIALDEHALEVRQQADGSWRIHQPGPNAYQPELLHNGQGAWRLKAECPLQWSRQRLLRRLGHLTESLSDEQLAAAADISGIDDAVLRHLHHGLRPMPPLLADSLARLRVDQRVEALYEDLREGLAPGPDGEALAGLVVELPNWPGRPLEIHADATASAPLSVHGRTRWPQGRALWLQASDLHNGRLSQALLAELSGDEIRQLLGPLSTPQQAPRLLREQLAKVFAAQRGQVFEHLYRQPPPTAADVQRLQRSFPLLSEAAANELLAPMSRAAREALGQGQGRLPLHVAEEARLYQRQIRLSRALEGLYRPGLASPDSQRLAEALQAQPGAPGLSLFARATADRALASRLLGQQPLRPWFRSPMRLADGRFGYPLGGSTSRPSAAVERLEMLFPGLDRAAIQRLEGQLAADGADLGLAIHALEQEYADLESSLGHWARRGIDGLEREAREVASERIMDAWQYLGLDGRYSLDLSRLNIGSLPALDARLEHIHQLRLDDMNLREVPERFLRAFDQVHTVGLSGNHLQAIPEGLAGLDNLRELELARNHLQAAPGLFEPLRGLPRLSALDLRGNQLATPSLEDLQVLASRHALRELNLSHNALSLEAQHLEVLGQLPLAFLDLSGNQLVFDEVAGAHFAQFTALRELRLSHNPLHRAPEVAPLRLLERLELNGCELVAWPAGLTRLMARSDTRLQTVDLSSNQIPHIPALQASEFARRLRAQGQPSHHLHVNFNPLDAASLAQLEALGVAYHAPLPVEDTPSQWLAQASEPQRNLWQGFFAEHGQGPLKDVLERMLFSREYQLHPAQVSQRIWELLELAAQHSVLRDELGEIAASFPATCGDAGADAFSELEVTLMSFRQSLEASSLGEQHRQVFQLYKRLFRRAEVQRLADRIALARILRRRALLDGSALPALDPLDELADSRLRVNLVDDIEIRLAVRQALAGPLDYPEPSQGMLFPGLAQVSSGTLSKIKRAVRASDLPAERHEWLLNCPSWQRYLKQRFAAQFDILSAFWGEGLDYLSDCLGPGETSIRQLDRSVLDVLGGALGENLLDAEGRLRPLGLDEQNYLLAVEALRLAHAHSEQRLLLNLTRSEELSR